MASLPLHQVSSTRSALARGTASQIAPLENVNVRTSLESTMTAVRPGGTMVFVVVLCCCCCCCCPIGECECEDQLRVNHDCSKARWFFFCFVFVVAAAVSSDRSSLRCDLLLYIYLRSKATFFRFSLSPLSIVTRVIQFTQLKCWMSNIDWRIFCQSVPPVFHW